MRKLLYSMLILGVLLTVAPKIHTYAVDLKERNVGNCEAKRNVLETKLENGIIRRESLNCYETTKEYCEEDTSDKNYKYITLRLDITYEDKFGKGIAAAYIESNFRYNTNYKESKCLSTSYGESVMNDDYKVSGLARTKNTTWTDGGAYGLIKLEKGLKVLDNNSYILKCDCNGCPNLTRG